MATTVTQSTYIKLQNVERDLEKANEKLDKLVEFIDKIEATLEHMEPVMAQVAPIMSMFSGAAITVPTEMDGVNMLGSTSGENGN